MFIAFGFTALMFGSMAVIGMTTKKEDVYKRQVRGLMALPAQTRASRNYMTVFINRRMIRSYRIQKAILEEMCIRDRLLVT